MDKTLFVSLHARLACDGDKWLRSFNPDRRGLDKIRETTEISYLLAAWAEYGGWD